jgi:3-dehydroquinate synthase
LTGHFSNHTKFKLDEFFPVLMPKPLSSRSLDISFSVPFVHRLRETNDLGGDCFGELVELLHLDRDEDSKPRVLVWIESSLVDSAESARSLVEKLSSLANIELVRPPIALEGGEGVKNTPSTVESLLEHIERSGLDRRSYIVAIGGGALLDAVGYAAAIAHRGIRLIRVPTTTLAQADSGVGVKNAINFFGKKNWIGTFAVPWAVINDAKLLDSLPDRDFRSGFSEAVKVSLLKSPKQFDWLCQNANAIRDRDMPIAVEAIHHSCVAHLRHITEGGDPFEMLEARPLDFGHWSAHKLEPLTGYRIRHGEAVGIGVAIDSIYSSMMHGFPQAKAEAVCSCLTELGLPLWDDSLSKTDELLDGLEEFRQHLGGRLTVTMLLDIGQPIDVHSIDRNVMLRAIDQLHAIGIG